MRFPDDKPCLSREAVKRRHRWAYHDEITRRCVLCFAMESVPYTYWQQKR